MDQRPPSSAYAAALGMTVAFGLSFVATKYALRGFQPMLVALLRFSIAGGLLWLLWRRRPVREHPSCAELSRLAALGFVSLTLYFALEINGIARTSASKASLIIATIPIFVAVLAALVLGEQGVGDGLKGGRAQVLPQVHQSALCSARRTAADRPYRVCGADTARTSA